MTKNESNTIYVMINNKVYGYFNIYSLIFEISGLAVIYYISKLLSKSSFLVYAGKTSYTIYLFHIQIVQKTCWNLPSNNIYFLLNPLIGLTSMVLIIWIEIRISKQIKNNKIIFNLVGLNGREVL